MKFKFFFGVIIGMTLIISATESIAVPTKGVKNPKTSTFRNLQKIIASVWITTPDQSQLLNRQADLAFAPYRPTSKLLTINVDEKQTFQQMDGFGASFTDSSAWLVYKKLTPLQRKELMVKLFDPVNGIGLSYLRQPMGSSDFSVQKHYTYNDSPNNLPDPELKYFSIDYDRAYIIPVIKQALQINPKLKIMATPWSAPAWMKSNTSVIGGSLKPDAYQPYAQYFVKFIQAYAKEGITIDAVTVQNEPLHSPDNYPGMLMSPQQQIDFIKNHLYPAFLNAGIKTKIIAYDHNWDEVNYPLTILSDSLVRSIISGVSFHGYAGNVTAQTLVRNAYPDKGIYFTEVSGGGWATNFASNLAWDVENLIIGSTLNWSKTVVKWNMVLNENNGPYNGGCSNCRGVATVNTNNGRIDLNVEYYSLGHASKFVSPGAYRIGTNILNSGKNPSVDSNAIKNVAFKNPDGSIAVIVFNSTSSKKRFNIKSGIQAFSYTLEGGAVASFKFRA
jgi:glucosylceramidase